MQIRMEFVESTFNYQKYRWRDGDREHTLYIPRTDFRFCDDDVQPPKEIMIIVSSRKVGTDLIKENERLRREVAELSSRLVRVAAAVKGK